MKRVYKISAHTPSNEMFPNHDKDQLTDFHHTMFDEYITEGHNFVEGNFDGTKCTLDDSDHSISIGIFTEKELKFMVDLHNLMYGRFDDCTLEVIDITDDVLKSNVDLEQFGYLKTVVDDMFIQYRFENLDTDVILDKINEMGYNKLTPSDKYLLDGVNLNIIDYTLKS
jgi:hypothetical protein